VLKYLKLAINIPSIIVILAKWISISWIENFINPILQKLSEWTGASMDLIEGILIGAIFIGSLWWLFAYKFKRNIITRENNDTIKNHAGSLILNKKSESLLALPEGLQNLRDLDNEIYNRRKNIKISESTLVKIQKQIQMLTDITSRKIGDTDVQEVMNTIKSISNEHHIKGMLLDENTQAFMLKVTGALDDNKVGLSRFREKDKRYQSLNQLTAYIETNELLKYVKLFKWSSLGMNSLLLMTGIFPRKTIEIMLAANKTTMTGIKAERDNGLDEILKYVNVYIRTELSNDRK